MGKGTKADCVNATFTPELYEDDFTAINAIKLLERKPEVKDTPDFFSKQKIMNLSSLKWRPSATSKT